MEKDAKDIYDQLAQEEPIRDSDDNIQSNQGDFNLEGDKPLDYYENNTPNLTDFQALIKTLSPEFKDDVYNAFLYSRLSPDAFNPLLKIAVNNEIKRQNPYKPLDVPRTVMKLYIILTRPLDGKHTIDILEAFGSKVDTQDMGAMGRGGLGGF